MLVFKNPLWCQRRQKSVNFFTYSCSIPSYIFVPPSCRFVGSGQLAGPPVVNTISNTIADEASLYRKKRPKNELIPERVYTLQIGDPCNILKRETDSECDFVTGIQILYIKGTPTKCQVSKRQVSKRQVYKTSGLQNVKFQNLWFQNVWFQNVHRDKRFNTSSF